jgi:hypothetical protein
VAPKNPSKAPSLINLAQTSSQALVLPNNWSSRLQLRRVQTREHRSRSKPKSRNLFTWTPQSSASWELRLFSSLSTSVDACGADLMTRHQRGYVFSTRQSPSQLVDRATCFIQASGTFAGKSASRAHLTICTKDARA